MVGGDMTKIHPPSNLQDKRSSMIQRISACIRSRLVKGDTVDKALTYAIKAFGRHAILKTYRKTGDHSI